MKIDASKLNEQVLAFHAPIRQVGKRLVTRTGVSINKHSPCFIFCFSGTLSFAPEDVANSDEIPLSFSGSDSRKTVTSKGVDDVAVQESANWDKRMSTVLVTIFGKKQRYVEPFIVFAGKETRITTPEASAWDKNVHV